MVARWGSAATQVYDVAAANPDDVANQIASSLPAPRGLARG